MIEQDSRELLRIHRETGFVFDQRGRMVHERAPDRTPGRRFSLTGCEAGNLAVIRADVPDDVASALDDLVSSEPPLCSPEQDPVHARAYAELLGQPGSETPQLHGLLWVFPPAIRLPVGAGLVWSGSTEGDALVRDFAEVVADDLAAAGFASAETLWEPWCVALVDGRLVSIAETVRSGPQGVEVGVDTSVRFRSRGLASAAVAGWSRHPAIEGQARFYSTSRENRASRRVAERLGLAFLGSSFAIA